MPVRGLLHSKCWYNLKIGAINVMRALAVALFSLISTILAKMLKKYHISRNSMPFARSIFA
jgi:hypothetical protein